MFQENLSTTILVNQELTDEQAVLNGQYNLALSVSFHRPCTVLGYIYTYIYDIYIAQYHAS
jgi:hypothetical protein